MIIMMNINKSNSQFFCEIDNEIKLINDISLCGNNEINHGIGWNSSLFTLLIYGNRNDDITIDYGGNYQYYTFNVIFINKPIINQIELKSTSRRNYFNVYTEQMNENTIIKLSTFNSNSTVYTNHNNNIICNTNFDHINIICFDFNFSIIFIF